MEQSLRSFTAPILAFALFGWLAMQVWPQSSNGNLRGVVQDQAKAVVPGVTVLLTNQGAGVELKSISNDAGLCVSLENRKPGDSLHCALRATVDADCRLSPAFRFSIPADAAAPHAVTFPRLCQGFIESRPSIPAWRSLKPPPLCNRNQLPRSMSS